MFFHMQSKTQTLETVLHGGSWLHGILIFFPKKNYEILTERKGVMCYEVLQKKVSVAMYFQTICRNMLYI
ncbi:unnamed protein product, partial [Brassica oleracea var. botrytis]